MQKMKGNLSLWGSAKIAACTLETDSLETTVSPGLLRLEANASLRWMSGC